MDMNRVTMGKRSDFKRIARDLYNTPAEAVWPLLPWLEPGTLYVDPCYGQGCLREHLGLAGHRFCGGFDLPIDARVHQYGMNPGEFFITNPPYWGRPKELHPLIENLSNQAPTWLLMSADWLFNLSSATLMAYRANLVVAIGRVKWIPGSPHVGKDNCAWIKFERQGGCPLFVGRIPTGHEKARQRAPERAGGPWYSG